MRRGTLCTLPVAWLLFVSLAAPAAEPANSSPDIKPLLEKAEAVREWHRHNPGAGPNHRADSDQNDAPKLSDEELKRLTEYYRGEFPFRSLRDRLAYEKSLPPNRAEPKLNTAAKTWLKDEDEPNNGLNYKDSLRSYALEELHSDQVRRFITQEGFGLARFEPPSPQMLALPEVKPVRSSNAIAISSEHLESPRIDLPKDEPTTLDLIKPDLEKNLPEEKLEGILHDRYSAWAAQRNPLHLPTIPRLLTMNEDSYNSFASRSRIGYAKDIDHVAGFSGHAMSASPQIDLREPLGGEGLPKGDGQPKGDLTHLWRIRRMNLVSLLKFPQPAVYESENVPAMQELVKAKTRPLDKFEADALQKLRDGEQIVVASQTNRILMLGSLRATKRCLDCHSVQSGELLGAFSYELIRVKPISIARSEKASGG